jgi:hypothetical protein
MNEPILCYANRDWAYFTTLSLEKQKIEGSWQIPYEHNSIQPYDEGIIKVGWDGWFSLPCDGHFNSPYSVDAINAKAIPWLRPHIDDGPQHGISIFAGTPLSEFISLVKQAGGKVYREV